MPSAIPIIKKEEKLYAEIHQSDKGIVDINYAFFQIPKEKLAKIFQSKGETFCMKSTIWKSEEETRYALSDSYFKANQGSDFVIINLKLVKILGFKIRPTNTLSYYRFGISIANGDSTELQSWVKF